MQITNSTTNFTSRNIDIRRADDIVRHANKVAPHFNPTYALENWRTLDTTKSGSYFKRTGFYAKFEKLISKMRQEYGAESAKNPTFYFDLFDKVKSKKIGNCYEQAYLTLGTLFSNGYNSAMKVGLEMEIGAYDKASGKCVATKTIPIDHTTVISTMNNPNRTEIDKTIVLDGWFNKAMTVSEAKKEYEIFVPKRRIESELQELQDELRRRHRPPMPNRFLQTQNSQFDINNFEFRKSIEFLEDRRFSTEEARSFGGEILKKYPEIKLNATKM